MKYKTNGMHAMRPYGKRFGTYVDSARRLVLRRLRRRRRPTRSTSSDMGMQLSAKPASGCRWRLLEDQNAFARALDVGRRLAVLPRQHPRHHAPDPAEQRRRLDEHGLLRLDLQR